MQYVIYLIEDNHMLAYSIKEEFEDINKELKSRNISYILKHYPDLISLYQNYKNDLINKDQVCFVVDLELPSYKSVIVDYETAYPTIKKYSGFLWLYKYFHIDREINSPKKIILFSAYISELERALNKLGDKTLLEYFKSLDYIDKSASPYTIYELIKKIRGGLA